MTAHLIHLCNIYAAIETCTKMYVYLWEIQNVYTPSKNGSTKKYRL